MQPDHISAYADITRKKISALPFQKAVETLLGPFRRDDAKEAGVNFDAEVTAPVSVDKTAETHKALIPSLGAEPGHNEENQGLGC